MIKSNELENRGPAGTGEPRGSDKVRRDLARVKGKSSEEQEAIALAAARELRAPAAGIHCGHCWGLGRDAAILAIEAESAS